MTAMPGDHDALGLLLNLDPTGRIAIEWRGGGVTYADLDAAVDELTRVLVEVDAPQTNVLVFGPLCPAYVVGLLACLRSGAVAVPVDAGMTAGQYAWTEDIARPSVILTSDVSTVEHYRGAADAGEIVMDAATGHIVLNTSIRQKPWRYSTSDAGYLIPTSGSTGAAKAIVGSRTGLHAFLSWFVGEFELGGHDTCAAVTRVNFDPSLRELLGVLAVGGKLRLPEVDAQLDPRALGRHFAQSAPTIAFLVPSLARRVGDALATDSVRLRELRLAFFAGEVLPPRVVEQWAELAPDAEFVNLYGMTEGTLAQFFRRDVRVGGSDGVPVGQPRPGVSVTIDHADGEVLISSSAPALGILVNDSGTVHIDPMPPVLRTGDVGFLTEHGDLMIAGRLGNALKVSGKRVSFDRFVDAVEDLAGVDQCVVIDRDGPHTFVAVAELTPDTEKRVHEIAQRLELPRLTIHLRLDLPLLRSGKVDRVALAASIVDTLAINTTSVEDTLLTLLAASSTTTSFVDAGLSSLDMMDFALEVNRRFGLTLSVQDCFSHRDVASLAQAITHADTAQATISDRPQDAADEPGAYPLSTRQVAYMATCMADGNANWCNLSREIQLDRTVTADQVTAAIDALIARHDVLRLTLTPDWSHQDHSEAVSLRCPITVHEAPDDEHRTKVQEARVHAVSELIDPTAPPPIRIVAVNGRTAGSVILVAHHLFVDGLSMDLLATELRTALLKQDLNDPPPHSYRSYCLATRRSPTADAADADYWRELLRGAEQIELPEAVGDDARSGELRSLPFGVTGSRSAHRLAAATGVSVFSIVLAAFDLAVSATFDLSPLTIVLPVQVREGVPTATAGMFMSQLIVRGKGSASLRDNAREFAGQVELGAAASSWEFDQRIDELGLGDTQSFPLSTVLFNQHPKPRGLRVRDLGAWEPRSLGRSLRYQLQGELQLSAAEMALTYYYRRGIARTEVDVIDQVHAGVLAALASAERTLDAD
jgi:acyl-coenzyme A synthetase/AMP-(fatty) acid ligase